MGDVLLATVEPITSGKVLAYARSSKVSGASYTAVIVNLNSSILKVSISTHATSDDGAWLNGQLAGTCRQYSLQGLNGDPASIYAELNGVALSVKNDGSIPVLEPRTVDCRAVDLPPLSITFVVVLPSAGALNFV